MRRALGWMCYRTVMMWPGAWPSGAVAGWILAWAGDYANDPPNDQHEGPEASAACRRSLSMRQLGAED